MSTTTNLVPIGNLQTWYNNQRKSVYLQIAISEHFNNTLKDIEVDNVNHLQPILDTFKSIEGGATPNRKYDSAIVNLEKIKNLIPSKVTIDNPLVSGGTTTVSSDPTLTDGVSDTKKKSPKKKKSRV